MMDAISPRDRARSGLQAKNELRGDSGSNRSSGGEALVSGMDATYRAVCAAQRELLRLIRDVDRLGLWEGDGARDMAHWLWMRYGISDWKARRWIACAHALDGLPRTARALASGDLGMDQVVELTRFATPEDEGSLISWARGVSVGAIRHKGDLA